MDESMTLMYWMIGTGALDDTDPLNEEIRSIQSTQWLQFNYLYVIELFEIFIEWCVL